MSSSLEVPEDEWAIMAAIASGRPVRKRPPEPRPAAAESPAMTDADWAQMFPVTAVSLVATAQALAPATPSAPAPESVPREKVAKKTADEIVAEQAAMPGSDAEETRQIQQFLATPEPAPVIQRVQIPNKAASKNPTRAIQALAAEVYELRLLVAEMHRLVVVQRGP
jgi:hypothetical protein